MEYTSVFDIIGPIMVGPSSSHTAGAARIGKIAHILFGEQPQKAVVTFYGSFAGTYKGHGSDGAVAAGLLGMPPFDERLKDSLLIAKQRDIEIIFQTMGVHDSDTTGKARISEKTILHPNTISIEMQDTTGTKRMCVTGESVGGGKINISEIDGFQTRLSSDYPTLLVFHEDKHGAIAHVSNILSENNINIAQMHVARLSKGEDALMTIEVDQPIDGDGDIIKRLGNIQLINRVINITGI